MAFVFLCQPTMSQQTSVVMRWALNPTRRGGLGDRGTCESRLAGCVSEAPHADYLACGNSLKSELGSDIAATCTQHMPQSADADAISEVSTTSSEGAQDKLAHEAVVQKWTSVPPRKKGKLQASSLSSTSLGSGSLPAAGKSTPMPKLRNQPMGRQENNRSETPHRQESTSWPQCDSKGTGKGKGLLHFRKIEVGIEDEPNFRVVQRLIGPKGRNMQDILTKARGAKIWIIGRGSRSWEDDIGPLVVCVGAASSSAFETAVRLVKELLDRVHEDHCKFRE